MRTQSVTYAEGSTARNKGAPRMASVGRVGHETPNAPMRRASLTSRECGYGAGARCGRMGKDAHSASLAYDHACTQRVLSA